MFSGVVIGCSKEARFIFVQAINLYGSQSKRNKEYLMETFSPTLPLDTQLLT